MSTTSEQPCDAPATPDALGSAMVIGSPMREAVDQTLREFVASGDLRRAIATLMREYGDAVFTRAYRVVEDRHAAKDVLQQTFLEAYRDLASFGGRSSFKTWLLGITTHRALDVVRRQRREAKRTVSDETLLAVADEAVAIPPMSVDTLRRLRALEDCLQVLAPEVRATVLMRFQQGMSYEQMARVSGDRSGTLHARVTRALLVLRRCMEDKGMAP
jgi:RNA polymerase sigma-70 factor (ECF subfamily)